MSNWLPALDAFLRNKGVRAEMKISALYVRSMFHESEDSDYGSDGESVFNAPVEPSLGESSKLPTFICVQLRSN